MGDYSVQLNITLPLWKPMISDYDEDYAWLHLAAFHSQKDELAESARWTCHGWKDLLKPFRVWKRPTIQPAGELPGALRQHGTAWGHESEGHYHHPRAAMDIAFAAIDASEAVSARSPGNVKKRNKKARRS